MTKSKKTIKFEKRNLADTLKRRKKLKEIQKLHQNRKSKSLRKPGKKAPDQSRSLPGSADGNQDPNPLDQMAVDEFFGEDSLSIVECVREPGGKMTMKKKRVIEPPITRDKTRPNELKDNISSAGSRNSLAEHSDGTGAHEESDDDNNEFHLHKRQLADLEQKDPEFFQYLKENDSELLEFMREDDPFSDPVDANDGEDEIGARGREQERQPPCVARLMPDLGKEESVSRELTAEKIMKWEQVLVKEKSLRTMREVVFAFRSAVSLNDHRESQSDHANQYEILCPEVFHQLLTLALRRSPGVFQHHLPVDESGKSSDPTNSKKKLRVLSSLLKTLFTAIYILIETLSDDATFKMVFAALVQLLPYVLSFRKQLRGLVRVTVDTWSDMAREESTRLAAYAILGKVMKTSNDETREGVLGMLYIGLLKGCRKTTMHTIDAINLMKNTGAELWGINEKCGYMVGFKFIRKLAMHLRTSITKKTKNAHLAIYNWQFAHSLDFWSRVVSCHCSSEFQLKSGKESGLRSFIYPIVQITLGSIRLIPSANYYPIRFFFIRTLIRISASTGTYIPLGSVLCEVLDSPEMMKSPLPSTLRRLDFDVLIRAPDAYLRTRVYQDGVGDQVVELLSETYVLWCKSPAFPELVLPVVVMLKKWLKQVRTRAPKQAPHGSKRNHHNRVHQAISLVAHKLEANARWIEERRERAHLRPIDRLGVNSFLKDEDWQKTPLGAFVKSQREIRDRTKAELHAAATADSEERRKSDANGRVRRDLTAGREQNFEDYDEDESEDNE